jgi:hypothetical protein
MRKIRFITAILSDPLAPFPQQRQKERRAASRLIDRPHDLLRQGHDLVHEIGNFRLVVFELSGEQLPARSIQYVHPVKFFARIYAHPDLVHGHLHPSLTDLSLCPWSTPPTAPYS